MIQEGFFDEFFEFMLNIKDKDYSDTVFPMGYSEAILFINKLTQ